MNFILYSYWVCTCYRLCGNQGKQRMFVLLCGLKRLSLYAMITTKIPALLFEENFIIMDVIPFGPICSYLICWVVLISKLSSTKCGVSAGSMIDNGLSLNCLKKGKMSKISQAALKT